MRKRPQKRGPEIPPDQLAGLIGVIGEITVTAGKNVLVDVPVGRGGKRRFLRFQQWTDPTWWADRAADEAWIKISGLDLPFDPVVRVGWDETEGLVATGVIVEVSDGPLEGRALRQIPLDGLFASGAVTAEHQRLAPLASPVSRKRSGGIRPLDRDLAQVARDFVAAQESHHRAPVKYLAEKYSVSRSTVGRWLREARRQRLLDLPVR